MKKNSLLIFIPCIIGGIVMSFVHSAQVRKTEELDKEAEKVTNDFAESIFAERTNYVREKLNRNHSETQ